MKPNYYLTGNHDDPQYAGGPYRWKLQAWWAGRKFLRQGNGFIVIWKRYVK